MNFTEVAAANLRLTDETNLKARAGSPAEIAYARQLISFAYRIEVGDLVIVPRLTKAHPGLPVARLLSSYEHTSHAPESGPHRRRVE